MQIEPDVANLGLRFSGFVARALALNPFDSIVLADCWGEGRDAADWLLALELIFRRLRERRDG